MGSTCFPAKEMTFPNGLAEKCDFPVGPLGKLISKRGIYFYMYKAEMSPD